MLTPPLHILRTLQGCWDHRLLTSSNLTPSVPSILIKMVSGRPYFECLASTNYLSTGNWIVEDCEVHTTSFEDLEKHLEGEDKEMFLDLMKGMITWRPEDRKTPRELIEHPWLQGICQW